MDATEIAQVEDRLELLRTLDKALGQPTALFQVVEAAANANDACDALAAHFDVPRLHAQAILSLSVSRWTAESRADLAAESKQLEASLSGHDGRQPSQHP